jgi:hypothetical protein
MENFTEKSIRVKNGKTYIYVSFFIGKNYFSIFVSKVINHVIFGYNQTSIDIFNNIITIEKDGI